MKSPDHYPNGYTDAEHVAALDNLIDDLGLRYNPVTIDPDARDAAEIARLSPTDLGARIEAQRGDAA